jgi:hypothetical protein
MPEPRLQIAAIWVGVIEYWESGSKRMTKSFSVPWPYVAIVGELIRLGVYLF